MCRITLSLWLLAVTALTAGCSGTTLSGSWTSPEFRGEVGRVYVVGVSGSELNRRMLETEFARELAGYGIAVTASYKDLLDAHHADSALLAARMKENGADSVLITRLVGTRTEQVVIPGRIREYRSWPTRRGAYPYAPAPHYRHWGSYYNRCCTELIYEPPTVSQFEVATIEANLYAGSSGELVWAAQLETVVENDLQKMVSDFVRTVARDLHEQGLI